MPRYYVNDVAQPNGDHEVHREGCAWLVLIPKKTILGYHSNCTTAIERAKTHYKSVNGCKICSKECHTHEKKVVNSVTNATGAMEH